MYANAGINSPNEALGSTFPKARARQFVDACQLSQINFDLYARANETSSLFPILRPENGRDLPVVY
jgi:hypothetical protein